VCVSTYDYLIILCDSWKFWRVCLCSFEYVSAFANFGILASVEIGLGYAMLYLLVPYISVFMQVFMEDCAMM